MSLSKDDSQASRRTEYASVRRTKLMSNHTQSMDETREMSSNGCVSYSIGVHMVNIGLSRRNILGNEDLSSQMNEKIWLMSTLGAYCPLVIVRLTNRQRLSCLE